MISSSIYAITFVIILVAFLLIRRNFVDLRNHDEGTEDMQEIIHYSRKLLPVSRCYLVRRST